MPKKQDVSLRKKYRIPLLLLTCVSMFANMFIFDQPALMKEQIVEQFSPIYGEVTTNFYFSLMYSFYSIPNIVLPLIGGFMSDLIGYRQMSLVFMFFIVLGQGTIILGTHLHDLYYMIFGRFLFGLGGESLGIASSIIINKWFVGQELSFANALNLSLIRSATVLNTMVTPHIAEKQGMQKAFEFGWGLTMISALGLILMNMLDSYVEMRESEQRQEEEGILNNSKAVIDIKELFGQIQTDLTQLPRV